jgi:hypothetical protein
MIGVVAVEPVPPATSENPGIVAGERLDPGPIFQVSLTLARSVVMGLKFTSQLQPANDLLIMIVGDLVMVLRLTTVRLGGQNADLHPSRRPGRLAA